MPLPWKKKPRSARISGLLADFQAPPKRGGSLVVETGFPTSLIDLFVKNRDRLKKSQKRAAKHSRRGRQHPDAGTSAATIDPPRAADQFREDGPGAEQLPCTDDDRLRRPESEVDEDVDEAAPPVPTPRETPYGKGSSTADRVPWAVLTVFAVAALALCTKGLAVGITIPAVVLLFLEHMGIVIPRLWKHWRADDYVPSSRYKRRSFVFEGTEKCLLSEAVDEEEVAVEHCNSGGEIKTIETSTVAAVPGQGVDSVGPDPEPRVLIQDRRPGSLEAEAETSPASSHGAKKKQKVLKRIAMGKKPRNPKKGETVQSRS